MLAVALERKPAGIADLFQQRWPPAEVVSQTDPTAFDVLHPPLAEQWIEV
jgi:hypothetical protein